MMPSSRQWSAPHSSLRPSRRPIALAIMEMIAADAAWDTLLHDPRTPQVLDKLWAEAMDEVKEGKAEEITGDGFNS